MKLSVPVNWDLKLLDNTIGEGYPISDFYGSSPLLITGSGRPFWSFRERITDRQISEFIHEVHRAGAKFTYLLNAPCFGNREFEKKWRKKLIRMLNQLSDFGVDRLTISSPYLLQIIKDKFPHFLLSVSIISQVDSVRKVKFFENMGVDQINVHYMCNRDFERLKNIRRSTGLSLQLLLNDFCLLNCPSRIFHYNISGHASQPGGGKVFLDPYLLQCTIKRLESPIEMMRSPWIRPEDINAYENIGYDSFKIAGRTRTTEWITNAVRAYASRSYPGNLIDILDSLQSTERPSFPSDKEEKKKIHSLSRSRFRQILFFLFKTPISKLPTFYNWHTALKNLPGKVTIDNLKLNGFLDYFREGRCDFTCLDCDYCHRWTSKAVILKTDEIKVRLKSLLAQIIK